MGCGRLAGSSGWIAAQTSSGTSCSAIVDVVMAPHHPRPTATLGNNLLVVYLGGNLVPGDDLGAVTLTDALKQGSPLFQLLRRGER